MSISETDFWDFPNHQPSVEKKTLQGEWSHYIKNTGYNQVSRIGRWATATEAHSVCHSYRLRTENSRYNSYRLTKIVMNVSRSHKS